MKDKNLNPFNISFGEEPVNLIDRNNEFNEIIDNFNNENPQSKSLIITGPRGSGKTVLLSMIKKYYDEQSNWITIDLNPFEEMHEQLAAKLYDKGNIKRFFLKSEFNFSFSGISFSISGKNPITNVNSLLEIMLEHLKKKGIKVLIFIDDVSSNNYMKSFIYSYQSFLRNSYLSFLIMTGLYENISELENNKNLTFLLRTPKITLDKLNLRSISFSYENIFNIDEKEAIKLSKITMGYAYGYQLLGNLLFKNNSTSINKKILNEYDVLLEDNVYGKIWSSLSEKEKDILKEMVDKNDVKDIIKDLNITNSALQVYKKRLSKQGLIDIKTRGKITFSLPRFKEFVNFQIELDK